MIAVHLEPKGLAPDVEPLETRECDRWLDSAVKGSRLLRNAILRAKGHPVPDEPRAAHVLPFRRPTPPKPKREPAVEPAPAECCDKCGAPLKPLGAILVKDVQAAVTAYYRLSENALESEQRGRAVAHPRQLAMLLASELTNKSIADIGRRFNRDHTTALYAIRTTKHRIATDPEAAHDYATVRRMLGR